MNRKKFLRNAVGLLALTSIAKELDMDATRDSRFSPLCPVEDPLSRRGFNVKDFGAIGDGKTDDTVVSLLVVALYLKPLPKKPTDL